MKKFEPYSKMFTEDLVQEVVEDGIYASFEGCMEIVNRKDSAIDYLLDYIGDDYYWDLDAEGDGYAPIISLCLLASIKAPGLSERILTEINLHYDELECMEEYIPSVIADLCEHSLESLHKALLDKNNETGMRMDILWALEIIATRSEKMRTSSIAIIGEAIRLIDEGILCSVAVMVAAEMNAGELGAAIDDAFLRGRIDRKMLDQEDIIFDSEGTQSSEYLPPFEFLQPSNLKRIIDEYVDDVLDNDTTDDPEFVMNQYYGDAKVNDPCPCGSGQKHKKCCLPLIVERKKWSSLEDSLRDLVEEYYDEDRFRDVVADALATFRKASGLEKTSNNLILVDWIIHDYIIRGEKMSIITKFAREKWASLNQDQKETISYWIKASFTIVEVQSIRPGLGYTVQELFPGGDTFFVSEIQSSLGLARYDILFIRIYRIKGLFRVSGFAIIFPYSMKGNVLRKIDEMYAEYRSRLSSSTPQIQSEDVLKKSFMRGRSAQIVGELVRMSEERKLPVITTPEGDLLTFVVKKFDIYNRDAVMDALESSPQFQYDDHNNVFTIFHLFPETSTEQKTSEAPLSGDRVYGTIMVGEQYIEVSCMSEKRMDATISLLENTLGSLMGNLIMESIKGVEEALSDRIEYTDTRGMSDELPGIQKSMDDYYMNWLDEKIPALEGKTPREAANDPLLVGRLEDLLKEFENHSEHFHNAPVPPIPRMRAELGLER